MFKSLPTLLLTALFVFATFLCPTADAAAVDGGSGPFFGPGGCLMGDANGNGQPCDPEDLDMFIGAVNTGLFYDVFDFNTDGVITSLDIEGYVDLDALVNGPKGGK